MDGDVRRDIDRAGAAVRNVVTAVNHHEPAAPVGADGRRRHAGLGLHVAVPGVQGAAAGHMKTARGALGGGDVRILHIGHAVLIGKDARAAGDGGVDGHVVHIQLAVGDEEGGAHAVEAGGVAAGAHAAVGERGIRHGGRRAVVHMDDVLIPVHGLHGHAVESRVLGDVQDRVVAVGLPGAAAPRRRAHAAAGERAHGQEHAQRHKHCQELGSVFH